MTGLDNDWQTIIGDQFSCSYYLKLLEFLSEEEQQYTIYPPRYQIFAALQATSLANTKVVILGQDPYHGPQQSHGLCFSVMPGTRPPPSLRNMFKELRDDIGCAIPKVGYLLPWAEQGVLLLNTVLTVRAGEAASHRRKGWETFTDAVVDALNGREQSIVFVLWGNDAQKKGERIDERRHAVIRSVHPSPLSASRGFFGSKPYSKVNAYLKQFGSAPIDWCLN